MSIYTPTPQEFDDWAATLDQDILESIEQFPFEGYFQVLDEVTRQARVSTSAAVLDLGIGTGNLAERFLALGCKVYGLDFSSKMLATARAKFPQLQLAQADLSGDWSAVLRWVFQRNRFDVIVSGYTFHHFELTAKVRLLVELSEHLLPGGQIVIGDISFENLAQQEAARQRWGELWEEEDYWIADQTLTACRQAGMQASYQQISSCAGVYAIQPVGNEANKEQS